LTGSRLFQFLDPQGIPGGLIQKLSNWRKKTVSQIPDPMDAGPQPLLRIMEEANISNADLVKASSEQLTHKQIQKARKGRKVTLNIQKKILNALVSHTREPFDLDQLFNYRGH
jgi:hypothetical protein